MSARAGAHALLHDGRRRVEMSVTSLTCMTISFCGVFLSHHACVTALFSRTPKLILFYYGLSLAGLDRLAGLARAKLADLHGVLIVDHDR